MAMRLQQRTEKGSLGPRDGPLTSGSSPRRGVSIRTNAWQPQPPSGQAGPARDTHPWGCARDGHEPVTAAPNSAPAPQIRSCTRSVQAVAAVSLPGGRGDLWGAPGLSTSQGNLLFHSLPDGVYPTCAELTGIWLVCFSHFSQDRAPLVSVGWGSGGLARGCTVMTQEDRHPLPPTLPGGWDLVAPFEG